MSKNKNYTSGANFERKVRQYFEDSGFIASRAAGSHGDFDIIADDGQSVWYIQCKHDAADAPATKLADKLTEMVQKKFPKIGHPIAVMVATTFKSRRPHGAARLLVPRSDTTREKPDIHKCESPQ